MPTEVSVNVYNQIRGVLQELCPDQWQAAVELCGAVPDLNGLDDPAAMQSIWMHGRDKPLRAGIRVTTGEAWVAAMASCPEYQDFNTAADTPCEDWQIHGKHRPPVRRLERIRRLAAALVEGRIQVVQFGDAYDAFRMTIDNLADGIGHGWGRVTVCHVLTDLGVCAKPDIHFTSSLLRWFPEFRAYLLMAYGDEPRHGRLPRDLPNILQQNLTPDEDTIVRLRRHHEIQLRAAYFGILLGNMIAPEVGGRGIREVDKVLMEANRQEGARNAINALLGP